LRASVHYVAIVIKLVGTQISIYRFSKQSGTVHVEAKHYNLKLSLNFMHRICHLCI